jgi:hypothetical protein
MSPPVTGMTKNKKAALLAQDSPLNLNPNISLTHKRKKCMSFGRYKNKQYKSPFGLMHPLTVRVWAENGKGEQQFSIYKQGKDTDDAIAEFKTIVEQSFPEKPS